jgi:hypothetical protein
MQTFGLVGGAIIYLVLTTIHFALRASVLRFIAFDAPELELLLIAAWITRQRLIQGITRGFKFFFYYSQNYASLTPSAHDQRQIHPPTDS